MYARLEHDLLVAHAGHPSEDQGKSAYGIALADTERAIV